MRALRVDALGEPRDVLQIVDVPKPVAGPGQLTVKVLAAAVNFPDVMMCRGSYQVRPDLPFTPGVEVCGEVVELGPAASGFAVGDRVVGVTALPWGGFAEFAVMSTDRAFPAPESLDDTQAAALHIGYQTAWFALHRRAAIKPGETLLVHAAAGGVGSAAVQLGRAAGARVIAVVGGEPKARIARELGADVVIDRRTQDFVSVIRAQGRGVDVVFDPVGGAAYQGSTKCINFEGRIVVVGFAGGEVPAAALNHALVKNYSILGLHWGLYATEDPEAVRECHRRLSELAASGVVVPLVSERLALAELAQGVQRLADGETVGRVVFEPK